MELFVQHSQHEFVFRLLISWRVARLGIMALVAALAAQGVADAGAVLDMLSRIASGG